MNLFYRTLVRLRGNDSAGNFACPVTPCLSRGLVNIKSFFYSPDPVTSTG
jgi:hypothetical protein